MSKRLQVLVDDKEFEELQRMAQQRNMTLSEWVRQALRRAANEQPLGDQTRKLAAIRAAARHRFPAPDIEEMQAEIESGYRSGLPE